MQCSPAPAEVIVVADGETDGSWRIAEELGARVVRLPASMGPARARNLGASAAKGDILFFVDADVVVYPDVVGQVIDALSNDPTLAAVFGSYDDEPSETNFLSQYKNLFHHYVHQTAREDSSSFWGACGAIRREAFLSVGGFEESYRHPEIEDIALGNRLKAAGHRIRLLKTLRVKHLKRWEARNLIATDFFHRALPWTDLILGGGQFINDLNIKLSDRMSVALIHLALTGIVGTVVFPWLLLVSLAAMLSLLPLNMDLYLFFKDKRGAVFALKAIPWHWLYLHYCGVAFFIGVTGHYLRALRGDSQEDVQLRCGVAGKEASARLDDDH
jgi:GT2 family glycosyltransferase